MKRHPKTALALLLALAPAAASARVQERERERVQKRVPERVQEAAPSPGEDLRITPEVRVVRSAAPAVVYVEAKRNVASINALTGQLVQRTETVTGSGVVVEKSGYVITNLHVVGRDGRRVTIEFDPALDGTVYEAEFVSGSPSEDLALLRIKADREFPVVRRGTSADLMIGERVVAIGNPFRQRLSVSSGIISGLHRSVSVKEGLELSDLIQTDAAINHGNSGGPLLNVLGELIGINTVVSSSAENMGFAIPVDRVEAVLREHLMASGAARAWLGLEVDEEGGLAVREVVPGGPAARAGVVAGERLLSMDGHVLTGAEDFRVERLRVRPGATLTLELASPAGDVRSARLVAWERTRGVLFQKLGLSLEPFGMPGYRRVRVSGVDVRGPAQSLGLAAGDVIDTVRVGRAGETSWTVHSPEDFAALVSGLVPGSVLTLDVLRDADGDGRFQADEILRGELTVR